MQRSTLYYFDRGLQCVWNFFFQVCLPKELMLILKVCIKYFKCKYRNVNFYLPYRLLLSIVYSVIFNNYANERLLSFIIQVRIMTSMLIKSIWEFLRPSHTRGAGSYADKAYPEAPNRI